MLQVAKEIGYLPSISARRLRKTDDISRPIITILWTLDARASLISRFLQGLQEKSLYKDGLFELLIQPYENGKLNEVESLHTGTRFNGAIIANASSEDLDYIESVELKVPVVLYQRYSRKYSTVNVDSSLTGTEVAEYLAKQGHEKVGIVLPEISSQAVDLRKEGFLKGAKEFGVQVTHTLTGDFTEKGGYKVIQSIVLNRIESPTALFFLSDPMAMGAISACHEYGIRIPDDLVIIGHDNDEQTAYAYPALTTVHLPVEEMAFECVDLLMKIINHEIASPKSVEYKTHLVIRKSG
ncbi:MAG: LacI family transcriptional regulator [Bacillus sp. (in: Bacteria)]|nr:LacI family transcriptional regulator [Bacillus sp. (in: firmicutes)]